MKEVRGYFLPPDSGNTSTYFWLRFRALPFILETDEVDWTFWHLIPGIEEFRVHQLLVTSNNSFLQ